MAFSAAAGPIILPSKIAPSRGRSVLLVQKPIDAFIRDWTDDNSQEQDTFVVCPTVKQSEQSRREQNIPDSWLANWNQRDTVLSTDVRPASSSAFGGSRRVTFVPSKCYRLNHIYEEHSCRLWELIITQRQWQAIADEYANLIRRTLKAGTTTIYFWASSSEFFNYVVHITAFVDALRCYAENKPHSMSGTPPIDLKVIVCQLRSDERVDVRSNIMAPFNAITQFHLTFPERFFERRVGMYDPSENSYERLITTDVYSWYGLNVVNWALTVNSQLLLGFFRDSASAVVNQVNNQASSNLSDFVFRTRRSGFLREHRVVEPSDHPLVGLDDEKYDNDAPPSAPGSFRLDASFPPGIRLPLHMADEVASGADEQQDAFDADNAQGADDDDELVSMSDAQ